MKKIILPIIILAYCRPSMCDNSDVAARKAVEAILKTKEAKEITKRTEKIILQILPVEKEVATTIGTAAVALANKEINTNNINNLGVSIFGGTVRADVKYKLDTQKSDAFVKLNWNW